MKQFAICGISLALLVACEPPRTQKSGDVSGTGTITVSGQFVSGSAIKGIQEGITRSDDTVRSADVTGTGKVKTEGAPPHKSESAVGQPLPGHALRCVTLQDPLRSGEGTADENGQFALEMDAAGIPFGCFVVDPGGEHVADLLFVGDRKLPSGEHELRGADVFYEDQDLGPVWVDRSTSLALVASRGESGTPLPAEEKTWDPSGSWEAMECLDPTENKGCSIKELFFYTAMVYETPITFLNRVAGVDISSGGQRYLLDMWDNEESFANCGRTEGISREKAREVYGLDLAPETNTAPFTFRDEPPGASSWDPDGSCVGPIDKSMETLGRCVEVGSPWQQSLCYYDCLISRSLDDPQFNLCVQHRYFDDELIWNYLQSPDESVEPSFAAQEVFTFTGAPLASTFLWWGSEAIRLPEMTYQNAHTWSTTFVSIDRDFPFYFSETLGYCDFAFTFQIIATRLAENEAVATIVFSSGISQTSKDFDFCVKNAGQIPMYGAPIDLGTSVRYRVRLRRSQAP